MNSTTVEKLGVGAAIAVVLVLIFAEIVSFAHAYKNVNRFFFSRITYTVGSSIATISKTQDPYECFGQHFHSSLVTVSTEAPYSIILSLPNKSEYSFDGATIDAQTEDGGFVSVDKSLANELILTPYTLNVGYTPTLNAGTNTIDVRIVWEKKASK